MHRTPMPTLSFRVKLLLAMMLVVVGITGTTLFLGERRFQVGYRALFEEQFDAQVRFFSAVQESRLAFVKQQCRELVRSVRIREALRTAITEGDLNLLYQNAPDELRSMEEGTGTRGGLTFFRFFDARGRVLLPGAPASGGEGALERELSLPPKLFTDPELQFVGFAAWTQAGRPELQEVIVTKVIDDITGDILGAVMLAFPVPELREPQAPSATPGRTREHLALLGLFFDGRLYARPGVVPQGALPSLSEKVKEQIARSPEPPPDFVIDAGGEPYRVFYRAPNAKSPLPTAYPVFLFSLGDAQRDQRALGLQILGFGALALAGALGLSLLLSNSLAVPIRELVGGTQEIQRGDFDVRVPIRSRDEIGQLAASFNEMAGGLALKERYRHVLNMVSDEKIAAELMGGSLVLGGERRELSVLFCDIRGFTALTERMAPEEVIEVLNDHMTALTRVVKQHDGVVDKFVGDLIMALFGAPVRRGDHAVAAARCAVRMVEERELLNQTSRHKIRMGIGVATGEAVAGLMGSADRLNYTVLGERVNLASRLCGSAGPMQVVIDHATYEHLGKAATVVALEPLALKGFSEPVPAYRLIAVDAVDGSQLRAH
jgi:class 3 adenylate cyclase